MQVHLFHKGRLESEALSRLLTNNGYRVSANRNLYSSSTGRAAHSGALVLLVDAEVYAASASLIPEPLAAGQAKIILLGKTSQLHYLFTCSAPCKGFVSKKDPVRGLFASIDTVDAGSVHVSKDVIRVLRQPKGKRQQELLRKKLNVSLTKTELSIMQEIALGKTTQQISEERFRSSNTINNHRKNILRKLELEGSIALVRFATQRTDAIKTLVSLEENKVLVKDLIKNDER